MQERLKRELGLFDIFCFASGAMISSGLFILPGIAFTKVGPALFISYLIAAFLALPAMLSKAELTTAMPKAGGDYFFITRSMGFAIGTVSGVASWFSLSLKSAFALIGMSAYVALITNIPITVIAIFLCVFFVTLNLIGIKEAGMFQRFLVVGLLATLIFYIFKGFPAVNIARFVPFTPYGTNSIFATAGLVFISYGGLTKIASIAEEIKNPRRNIPLGLILSIIIVGILYAIVAFITTGVLDADKLTHSLTPISDGAYVFMGPAGSVIMAIAALLAFISTANAGIMSASRYPVAMSRDKILPNFFKKINAKFHTPHYSIVFTGAFMILAIMFLKLELLVKAASTFLIALFIFANLAVIIMRESKIQNYQPSFRSPLYPWMQIAGVVAGVFLIAEMGVFSYKVMGVFLVAGLIWYFLYVRPEAKKRSALVHVIARITARELTDNFLEEELKDILRERDEIVEDRFDHLIRDCEILDFEYSLDMKELFEKISDSLAKKLEVDAGNIFQQLTKREKESSTVIREGLAIPHIIIEGKHKFKILLVRCKSGITFPNTERKVHIVFALAGSKDERNFHLRALAAIAEIAQASNFDKKWMNARNIQELRDIILLAERKRFGIT